MYLCKLHTGTEQEMDKLLQEHLQEGVNASNPAKTIVPLSLSSNLDTDPSPSADSSIAATPPAESDHLLSPLTESGRPTESDTVLPLPDHHQPPPSDNQPNMAGNPPHKRQKRCGKTQWVLYMYMYKHAVYTYR